MNMHEKIQDTLPLRDRLIESERMMQETGCYDGVTELTLRKQDPLKFETLHTKLRASCVSARVGWRMAWQYRCRSRCCHPKCCRLGIIPSTPMAT